MYFKLLRFVLCKVYLNKAIKMKNEKNKVEKCFFPPGPFVFETNLLIYNMMLLHITHIIYYLL